MAISTVAVMCQQLFCYVVELHSIDMMTNNILVEACVDSVASSIAAERGGAGRLELCDALFDGGTTPSAGMIAACKAAVSIPVFVMIRPRGGGFVYSDAERDVMRRDNEVARAIGADGVAIGGLRPDNTVDLELVRLLVQDAHGLPVTFHRAFDFTRDLAESLESLAEAGVERILSSGGASTAAEGADVLGRLVRQAGPRLVVMAGGGVREENIRNLISVSGVGEVHVRLTRLAHSGELSLHRELRVRKALPEDERSWEETDEQRVRSFVETATGISATNH
jgi:copper homeostasis protein